MDDVTTVVDDPQLSDPRYHTALVLHNCVAMCEPLNYGSFEAAEIASEWHSGQWSALYSLSSTGELHDGEHQQDCIVEIEHNLGQLTAELATSKDTRWSKLDTECERLTSLLIWVKAHNFSN